MSLPDEGNSLLNFDCHISRPIPSDFHITPFAMAEYSLIPSLFFNSVF